MVESKKYENIIEKVSEYFRKNDIKNLMDYGCDTDEGLYHLSTMYEEILNKFAQSLEDIATVEKKPFLEGKTMFIILNKKI